MTVVFANFCPTSFPFGTRSPKQDIQLRGQTISLISSSWLRGLAAAYQIDRDEIGPLILNKESPRHRSSCRLPSDSQWCQPSYANNALENRETTLTDPPSPKDNLESSLFVIRCCIEYRANLHESSAHYLEIAPDLTGSGSRKTGGGGRAFLGRDLLRPGTVDVMHHERHLDTPPTHLQHAVCGFWLDGRCQRSAEASRAWFPGRSCSNRFENRKRG